MTINKHEIIKQIMAHLFEPEERRLEKAKDVLVKMNAEFYPDRPHDGFTYEGKVYDYADLVKGPRTRVPLHRDMTERMTAWLTDYEQVWGDRYYISQILALLLNTCDSLQDVRDTLPNCLMDSFPELRSYKRTRDEAYTIQADTRSVRQFKKVLPRIEFYATSRLLY